LWLRHNSPADRARKLLGPSENAKSLLASILKKLGSFGFELFWCDVTAGRGQGFLDDVIGSQEKTQVAIYLFLHLKETRKESESLEPLIGHLALVFAKLWLKNNN